MQFQVVWAKVEGSNEEGDQEGSCYRRGELSKGLGRVAAICRKTIGRGGRGCCTGGLTPLSIGGLRAALKRYGCRRCQETSDFAWNKRDPLLWHQRCFHLIILTLWLHEAVSLCTNTAKGTRPVPYESSYVLYAIPVDCKPTALITLYERVYPETSFWVFFVLFTPLCSY